MPRKPKVQPDTEAIAAAAVTPPAEPDVFDLAIARLTAAPAESVPVAVPIHIPPRVIDPDDATRGSADDAADAGESPKVPRRDPVPVIRVALTAEADGPVVRLWRSKRRREMAVTFDEKPAPEHTQPLKDAGFRWQPDKRAWTLPVDPDRRWAAHLDAERTFFAVANAVRRANGLEPVQALGV